MQADRGAPSRAPFNARRYRRVLLLAGLVGPLAAAPALAQETRTIVDDVGRSVTLDLPIERAVVFNRYAVEFVRAVGGSDVIVGVDASTLRDPPYWPEYDESMIAGQGQTEPNYEAIVALDPDLVIMPRNGVYEEAAAQLAPFGIPLLVVTAWDTLKHVENVTLIGELFGSEERADALNAFYTHYMDLLDERLEGIEPRRVYLEETRPYVSVTPGSGWHDMIEAGGGQNIYGDIVIGEQPSSRGNENGFTVDAEDILARDPEVVIKLEPGSYETIPQEQFAASWQALMDRSEIAASTAGQNGDVHVINYYLAGGSSKMIGALQVAKWLYPDLFEDIEPEDVMREWIEVYQGLPFQPDMTYSGPAG